MKVATVNESAAPSGEAGNPPGWCRFVRGGEDGLLAVVLAALMLLPVLGILLRALFHTGIPGANTLLQQFTLIIGMLGGALAAREGRLLSLSSLTSLLQGRRRAAARALSGTVAAVLCLLLGLASAQFVATEREGGHLLAMGIPVWVVQLVLPIGFILIAWRLVWHAADSWKGRVLVGGAATVLVGLFLYAPLAPETWTLPALILLFLATLCGAPVFVTIGGAALILLWGAQFSIAVIPLKHYSLVTNPSLPTIPLFTLAGYFLAESGASQRLIRVVQSLVGSIRGGPALVTVISCAFFTAFTGASGVTILALGGLLMPVLLAARYSERDALGLLTGAGSLGLLFAPCLPLILYSIVAGTVVANLGLDAGGDIGVSLEQMFLAGLIPGILLVALTAGWGILAGPASRESREPFVFRNAARAVWDAKWELMLPVVVLSALFGGFASPVEAAALTAFYAFVVEAFIYRDLASGKKLVRVMAECGLLVGGVLLILGVAMGFSTYLVLELIPSRMVEWVTANVHSRWVFLLALNGSLLVVGCLMDVFSAIVVVVPLVIPLGIAFGVDPVHLGIIFLANLELGYLTPPVGMNLFLSSYRFDRSLPEVYRSVLPVLGVLAIGVLLITYVPWLTLWLPGLFL